ncbi:MAG: RlmE family RNA methyltransferase [Proteobacteria bacterium]|nr:RlmE family RNA methyltransferase [Pseudomonadota bacterium]
MKQKNKTNTWEDHYSRKAKKEKFPARSVYKLKEIQQKFAILKKNDKVLDIGCAPGSWLLYTAQVVGAGGEVRGVDLKPVDVKTPAWVTVITGDIFEMDGGFKEGIGKGYHVVMSDMAPATTGRKDMDAYRSYNLSEAALTVAREVLEEGGNFICKIFQGSEFKNFTELIKNNFRQCRIFKPESCRKESKEIYIIGIGKK